MSTTSIQSTSSLQYTSFLFEKCQQYLQEFLPPHIINHLISRVTQLPYRDTPNFFWDLDDCLNPRFLELRRPLFSENRGLSFLPHLIREYGSVQAYVKKFYTHGWIPWYREYIQRVATNESTHHVLTAWLVDLQTQKTQALGIQEKPIVVSKARQKIIAMILFIAYELWYIPSEIIFTDDRIDAFRKHMHGNIGKILNWSADWHLQMENFWETDARWILNLIFPQTKITFQKALPTEKGPIISRI